MIVRVSKLMDMVSKMISMLNRVEDNDGAFVIFKLLI